MVSKYYQDRTNGVRNETWSQQVAGFLSGKARLDMLEQLNKSGLMKDKIKPKKRGRICSKFCLSYIMILWIILHND